MTNQWRGPVRNDNEPPLPAFKFGTELDPKITKNITAKYFHRPENLLQFIACTRRNCGLAKSRSGIPALAGAHGAVAWKGHEPAGSRVEQCLTLGAHDYRVLVRWSEDDELPVSVGMLVPPLRCEREPGQSEVAAELRLEVEGAGSYLLEVRAGQVREHTARGGRRTRGSRTPAAGGGWVQD